MRKEMFDANAQFFNGQAQMASNESNIIRLTQMSVQLNASLTQANPNDSSYNRLVGEVNANNSQKELLEKRKDNLKAGMKMLRGKANEAREAYVQLVLDMRAEVNGIDSNIQNLESDVETKNAIDTISSARGVTIKLARSIPLENSIKQLKKLEEAISSDEIPLRNDGSNTLTASVVINGKHTIDMCVDSGASLICLPAIVAAQLGIQPNASDPEITLELANGSRVLAKKTIIGSVRIGKFTVQNVECAVLGPEAFAATPLLGMSYLQNFQIKINPERPSITLVQVDGDSNESRSSKSTKSK